MAEPMSDERIAETLFCWEMLDSPEDPAWHGATATQRERWVRRAKTVREMYPEVVGLIERAEGAEAALARVEALHHPGSIGGPFCKIDGHRWPCATIRAVAADGQEAGR